MKIRDRQVQPPAMQQTRRSTADAPAPGAVDPRIAPDAAARNGLASTAPQARSAAAPGSTARLGPGLQVPGEPRVQNRSLAASLKAARKVLDADLDAFATRRPDNAYPGVLRARERVWTAVEDVTRRHTSRETPELTSAIDALKDFAARWRSSGDEMNMPRIAHGTSFARANGERDHHPGLSQLFSAIFEAAGMRA